MPGWKWHVQLLLLGCALAIFALIVAFGFYSLMR
jgi:hypothetical protein